MQQPLTLLDVFSKANCDHPISFTLSDGTTQFLSDAGVTQIVGYPGVGKSTHLATIAKPRSGFYLDCDGGISEKEFVGGNCKYVRILDLCSLMAFLYRIVLDDSSEIQVLVVDSLASLLRPIECNLNKRVRYITHALLLLNEIAGLHRARVFVVNQMTTKQIDGVFYHVPALGDVASNYFSLSLFMCWTACETSPVSFHVLKPRHSPR